MRAKTPEGYVLAAVGQLLTVRKIWWMRCQSGMQVLERAGKKRVFRAGRPGMADILAAPRPWHCVGCFDRVPGCGPVYQNSRVACPSASGGKLGFHHILLPSQVCDPAGAVRGIMAWPILLWIECKAPKGVQSDAQKAFQSEVEAEGHGYLLVRDAMEVLSWLS